ncbi:MAG TPA: dTDP-4-dehydrorhamnose reductase [Methanothermobacter sp.]|mgnify:CR=1 FL=1|jgi:dTDP-4-dehydrorhamnose reductase|uniref:NAD(P)-dependent oxidoreductase n=1 Tax=Methanothermobacter tenebrarum TaxID=680118 RepID=A0ABM7YEK0_9EURY|nr:dTDP-4-dehydrorhamnose reductase [Methanothermobacter tenebrarum]MDI6881545.1 dTDP-4-dehydrorhamnose reductase [Methanothermobacter sp.]MDX9693043.1 dTDP-4-dehydrorhamnose reductase [Methanothermobacter sp.]BDH79821.1 NAD(P)-dependent oxidoreductase [Methanothermobacter tenebrarum]HHW16727.1 dTDP-4-dehydrorhamnose reductase [Methanothermobacter sp.]HOQ19878.1 dTDP-4-dehydrorhamnose reductase [Methanothermobacter sp.]
MRIFITGATGMLGNDLVKVLSDDHKIITKRVEITSLEDIVDFICNSKPDAIIHTAAFTDVDAAESAKDKAYKVNVIGTRNVTLAASKVKAPIIYISTDYIFDGEKSEGYYEFDKPNPINFYGLTKYLGEVCVRNLTNKFYIVRTSWLFGEHGRNFVKTILELAEENEKIQVVDDQIGSPTYTLDLAEAIRELIKKPAYGIYHITNSGHCSWYEFAKEVFKEAEINIKLEAVSSNEFKRPARRPKCSILKNYNWKMEGFPTLRDYRVALKEYLRGLKF